MKKIFCYVLQYVIYHFKNNLPLASVLIERLKCLWNIWMHKYFLINSKFSSDFESYSSTSLRNTSRETKGRYIQNRNCHSLDFIFPPLKVPKLCGTLVIPDSKITSLNNDLILISVLFDKPEILWSGWSIPIGSLPSEDWSLLLLFFLL